MESNRYRSLWAAVLMQAIDDLSDKKPLIRRSAKHWLTRKKNKGIASFVWVCAALDIDPDKTRTRIFLNHKPVYKY